MLKFSKAIAANSDLETSQAFISKVFQDQTSEEIYLAFLISGAGENVFSSVRNSAADAIDEFFETSPDPATRLTKTFNFLKDSLMGVEELEILACTFKFSAKEDEDVSGVLYLANLGGQKAYLKRQDSLVTLSDENSNNQIISGNFEPGDKLLLINRGLDEFIFSGKKVEKLIEISPDDLEDELEEVVMAQRNGPPLSAILVHNPKTSPNPVEDLDQIHLNELAPLTNLETRPIKSSRVPINIPELVPVLVGQVKRKIPKGKKERLILACVAALLLLGLFLLVKQHLANARKSAQVQNLVSQARSSLDTANNLKDSDPTTAKKSLTDAENYLAEALKINPDDSNAKNLNGQLTANSGSILKIQTVTSWPLFLDLNLVKNGFTANRLSLSAGQMLLLDTSGQTLVEISLAQKTNNILAGSTQFGQGEEASLNGEDAFVYSKDKGVTMVDTQTLKATNVAKPDPDWGNIIDIQGFAGNFYLLDNLKNQIWKYVPTNSGFSTKNTYLNSGVVADFSGAQRFLIDSSIWVLRSNSEVDRYTAGSPDSFDVGGLDKDIQSISSFFISSDTNNMYIMDPQNSRIVVLQKSGQYVSQLVGDKFKDASDFIVDEQNKKLYLLENNKIYVIDLQ